MTKNAKDKSIRYDQTRRTIEMFLKDLRNTKQVDFHLESCNVCASCCAIEAVGATFKTELPKINGKAFMSQADLMFNFLYNCTETPVRSDTLCENEIPANLAFAINKMSTAKATLKEFPHIENMVSTMLQDLKAGKAVVLSYKTDYGGGHYICLVGTENGKILAYDSWGANKHCKNGGVLEEYDFDFFRERCGERMRYICVSSF